MRNMRSGDLPVRRVALGHRFLDGDRTLDRVDGAGNSTKHTVARRLDDAAPMRANSRVDERLLAAFSRASVPSSSAPMRRLYPATSAARIAASRRSIRSPVKEMPPDDP